MDPLVSANGFATVARAADALPAVQDVLHRQVDVRACALARDLDPIAQS